jgi:hypothetical protein
VVGLLPLLDLLHLLDSKYVRVGGSAQTADVLVDQRAPFPASARLQQGRLSWRNVSEAE